MGLVTAPAVSEPPTTFGSRPYRSNDLDSDRNVQRCIVFSLEAKIWRRDVRPMRWDLWWVRVARHLI